MAFNATWDAQSRRPVVDNKFNNPETGQVESAAGRVQTYGPPTIDIIWTNLKADSGSIRAIRKPTGPDLNSVYLQVAEHVQKGLYKLVAVNATEYSFIVLCESDASPEEWQRALKGELK